VNYLLPFTVLYFMAFIIQLFSTSVCRISVIISTFYLLFLRISPFVVLFLFLSFLRAKKEMGKWGKTSGALPQFVQNDVIWKIFTGVGFMK
jgi:hypothetical protein